MARAPARLRLSAAADGGLLLAADRPGPRPVLGGHRAVLRADGGLPAREPAGGASPVVEPFDLLRHPLRGQPAGVAAVPGDSPAAVRVGVLFPEFDGRAARLAGGSRDVPVRAAGARCRARGGVACGDHVHVRRAARVQGAVPEHGAGICLAALGAVGAGRTFARAARPERFGAGAGPGTAAAGGPRADDAADSVSGGGLGGIRAAAGGRPQEWGSRKRAGEEGAASSAPTGHSSPTPAPPGLGAGGASPSLRGRGGGAGSGADPAGSGAVPGCLPAEALVPRRQPLFPAGPSAREFRAAAPAREPVLGGLDRARQFLGNVLLCRLAVVRPGALGRCTGLAQGGDDGGAVLDGRLRVRPLDGAGREGRSVLFGVFRPSGLPGLPRSGAVPALGVFRTVTAGGVRMGADCPPRPQEWGSRKRAGEEGAASSAPTGHSPSAPAPPFLGAGGPSSPAGLRRLDALRADLVPAGGRPRAVAGRAERRPGSRRPGRAGAPGARPGADGGGLAALHELQGLPPKRAWLSDALGGHADAEPDDALRPLERLRVRAGGLERRADDGRQGIVGVRPEGKAGGVGRSGESGGRAGREVCCRLPYRAAGEDDAGPGRGPRRAHAFAAGPHKRAAGAGVSVPKRALAAARPAGRVGGPGDG